MSRSDVDEIFLEHVTDCIARVEHYTGGFRERFMDSELFQDVVVRNLHVLAESTTRPSERTDQEAACETLQRS